MLMNVSLLILHFVIRKIKIKKEILQLKKYISDDNLKNLLNKNSIKTKNNKISFSDVLLYKFLYTYKNVSKQYIVSKFNYDNELLINRTTYHKKELMMSDTFYKSLFYKIRNFYNDNFKTENYNLIAVDGTYNNTNVNNIKGKLETSLNMGFLMLMNISLLILHFVIMKIKIKKSYN